MRAAYPVFSFFFAIFSAFLTFNTVFAEEKPDTGFVTQFDPRERLPMPDMTTIGRVRFLTTVDFPPFNFIDQTNRLAGFHVDLAREICRQLKIMDRCQIEAMPFANLRAALDRGDGEVIAAGMAMTPDLQKEYAFSRTYLQLPARFITRKGTGRPPSVAALDGLPVGVETGTRLADMLTNFFPAIKPAPMAGKEALEALKAGKVAAVFGDGRQLEFWAASEAAAGCCATLGGPYYSEAFLGGGMALMMKGKDEALQAAINHALLELARNGRLEEIYLRYFPNGM